MIIFVWQQETSDFDTEPTNKKSYFCPTECFLWWESPTIFFENFQLHISCEAMEIISTKRLKLSFSKAIRMPETNKNLKNGTFSNIIYLWCNRHFHNTRNRSLLLLFFRSAAVADAMEFFIIFHVTTKFTKNIKIENNSRIINTKRLFNYFR